MGFSKNYAQNIKLFSKKGIKVDHADSSFYYGELISGADSDTIKFYYTESKINLATLVIKNGLLEGPFRYYYPNGKLKIQGNNGKGMPVGNVLSYYDNGNPKSTIVFVPPFDPMQYSENFKILNYWDANGAEIIKDGEGICKCEFDNLSTHYNPWDNEPTINFWYRDFEVTYLWEGNVKNGLRSSVWKAYKNGVQELEEKYDNGVFVEGVRFDEGNKFPYKVLVENAMPKDGMQGFYKFIGANMNYPKEARRKRIEGRVFIEFVLERNGSITEVKSIKAPHDLLAKEGERVVKLAPKWNPAQQRGKAVKQKMVIPLIFKLG